MVIRGIFVGAIFLGIAAGFAGCSDEAPGLDAGTSPTSTSTTTPTTTSTTTSTPDSSTPVPDSSVADTSVPDTSTGDSSTADASDGATAPTFTQVYALFTAGNRCTNCHGNAGAGGLSMGTKPTAYTNLTTGANTAACAGTTKRVVAGNAAMSKLFQKISGTTCGNRMPLNGGVLDAAQIKLVQDWINAGALDN